MSIVSINLTMPNQRNVKANKIIYVMNVVIRIRGDIDSNYNQR